MINSYELFIKKCIKANQVNIMKLTLKWQLTYGLSKSNIR